VSRSAKLLRALGEIGKVGGSRVKRSAASRQSPPIVRKQRPGTVILHRLPLPDGPTRHCSCPSAQFPHSKIVATGARPSSAPYLILVLSSSSSSSSSRESRNRVRTLIEAQGFGLSRSSRPGGPVSLPPAPRSHPA
jgi:hypothetical protein